MKRNSWIKLVISQVKRPGGHDSPPSASHSSPVYAPAWTFISSHSSPPTTTPRSAYLPHDPPKIPLSVTALLAAWQRFMGLPVQMLTLNVKTFAPK